MGRLPRLRDEWLRFPCFTADFLIDGAGRASASLSHPVPKEDWHHCSDKRSSGRAHQGSMPRPVANCLVPPVSRPTFSQMIVRLSKPEVKR